MQPFAKAGTRDVPVEGYKDPFIIHAEGAHHAYLIGQHRTLERIYHFRSLDEEDWKPPGSPYDSIMELPVAARREFDAQQSVSHPALLSLAARRGRGQAARHALQQSANQEYGGGSAEREWRWLHELSKTSRTV